MADNRKEYTVEVNGTETTVLLSDDDAQRYAGAKLLKPSNKAAQPSNKGA